MWVHACMCASPYVHVCESMSPCVHVCESMCVSPCVHVWESMCTSACVRFHGCKCASPSVPVHGCTYRERASVYLGVSIRACISACKQLPKAVQKAGSVGNSLGTHLNACQLGWGSPCTASFYSATRRLLTTLSWAQLRGNMQIHPLPEREKDQNASQQDLCAGNPCVPQGSFSNHQRLVKASAITGERARGLGASFRCCLRNPATWFTEESGTRHINAEQLARGCSPVLDIYTFWNKTTSSALDTNLKNNNMQAIGTKPATEKNERKVNL